jgi:hypothetical protein
MRHATVDSFGHEAILQNIKDETDLTKEEPCPLERYSNHINRWRFKIVSSSVAIQPNILDLRLPRVYSFDPATNYTRIWKNATSVGISHELRS